MKTTLAVVELGLAVVERQVEPQDMGRRAVCHREIHVRAILAIMDSLGQIEEKLEIFLDIRMIKL